MKKIWLLFVVATVVLLGWSAAGAEDTRCPHLVDCTDVTTCIECGATGLENGEQEYLVHGSGFYYKNLGDTHIWTCKGCHEPTGEESKHSAVCSAPDVCQYCDATGLPVPDGSDLTEYFQFHEFQDLSKDEYMHQTVCLECGVVYFEEYHDVRCQTMKCIVCFETDFAQICVSHYTIDENGVHDGFEYVNLGDQHQKQCTLCGFKEEAQNHAVSCGETTVCRVCGVAGLEVPQESIPKHSAYCDAPTVCKVCGTTGLELPAESVSHQAYCTPNGDKCEYKCVRCGYTEAWEHFVNCLTSICLQCQTVIEGDIDPADLWHQDWNLEVIAQNEQTHTATCDQCMQTFEEEHGFDENDVCGLCGYTKPAVLPGDPTGDGSVDIFDALAVLQAAVGWDIDIDQSAGDVNDNGACDIFDALLILQYAVGWDVELK